MPTTVAALLFSLFLALCAAAAFAGQSPAQQKTTAWWCVMMRCPIVPLIPMFPPWNISPQPPYFQPPLPPFVEPVPLPVAQPPPPPHSHHHSRRNRRHRHSPPLSRPRHHSRNHRHPPSLPRLRSATRNRKHTSGQCRLHHPRSHPPPTTTITIRPRRPRSPSSIVQHSQLPSSALNLMPSPPPTPPIPPPTPPIPQPMYITQSSNCSTELIKGDGCVRDLTQSFSGNQILIGRDCCKVILQLSDECFDKAFTQFSDPIFRNKARAFCSPQR